MGCLVHGEECSFSLREEDVEKGSEYVVEVIARALSRVCAKRCKNGRRHAEHLWIQCDNASGENKNQWMTRFAGVLVDRGLFETVVIGFLRKGHTHEDLDAIFGVLSGHVGSQLAWNSPDEMLEHVHRRMTAHLRPLDVHAGVLDQVRNWKEWLEPLDDIKSSRGVVNITGVDAAHWFCFCRRSTVPVEYATRLKPSAAGESPSDVVLLVKNFIHDSDLSQDIITFCHSGSSWRLPRSPPTWRPKQFFTPEYVQGLRVLVGKIREHFPERSQAIHYLNAWMSLPRLVGTNFPVHGTRAC